MHDVITIGSALVDIFIHTPRFTKVESGKKTLLCQAHGDKMEVESFSAHTGGGASNTAVGFSRLDFSTAIVCETGQDKFSYLVTKDLLENSVSTDLIIEEKKEQTGGSVILVSQDGERTVLVHRGAAAMLDPFDISTYWLSQAGHVHLSSIGGKFQTLLKIFKAVRRLPTTTLSWNPGKKELGLLATRRLLPGQVPAKIFIVNTSEWEMISNIQHEVLSTFEYTVVTAANKGGDVYQYGDQVCHYPAFSSKVIDTTGAGDSFAVGFTAGILWNRGVRQAAQIGAKNAASVVAYFGAKTGLLNKQDLEKV